MRREHSHCPQFVIIEAHIGEMDRTGNGPARERSKAGMKGEFPKSGVTRHRAGWWNMQAQGRQPGSLSILFNLHLTSHSKTDIFF